MPGTDSPESPQSPIMCSDLPCGGEVSGLSIRPQRAASRPLAIKPLRVFYGWGVPYVGIVRLLGVFYFGSDIVGGNWQHKLISLTFHDLDGHFYLRQRVIAVDMSGHQVKANFRGDSHIGIQEFPHRFTSSLYLARHILVNTVRAGASMLCNKCKHLLVEGLGVLKL